MKREEFVERILATAGEVSVPMKIKGFYEAMRWAKGINPCAGDSVVSGIIVECNEVPELVGRSLTIRKHWSYNGVHREYSEEIVERPHYEKEETEGYVFEYEEGVFYAWKPMTLEEVPGIKNAIVKDIQEQIRIAVDTRPLPGVKFTFCTLGCYRNIPCVVFGRSFKEDLSEYKKLKVERPWKINDCEIHWK